MRLTNIIITLIFLCWIPLAIYADQIPIEDLSQNSEVIDKLPKITQPSTPSTQDEDDTQGAVQQQATQSQPSLQQTTLEGKITNIEQLIANLRQQVLVLQSQVDIQAQSLQALNNKIIALTTQHDTQPPLESTNNDGKTSLFNPQESPAEVTPDQQTYNNAFGMVRRKQYADAADAMLNYLQGFPSGQYRANAQYWLGEIYYKQRRYSESQVAFETIISKYADSTKTPDAMFKLAMIYEIQGKTEQAQQELEKLRQQYPASSAARLAAQKLTN